MNATLKPSVRKYTQAWTRLPERDSHDFTYAYQDRPREASVLPLCE